MKTVNQSMRKKDAMQLVTGQPVYMDDVIPQDCLIVKLLRSPHANAIVQEIDTSQRPAGAGHRGDLHMEGCGPAGHAATPRRARPTPSRAPMTGLSSTAMSALRGMLSQLWPARMKNASIRRCSSSRSGMRSCPPCWTTTRHWTTPSLFTRRKTGSRCAPVGRRQQAQPVRPR